MDRFGVVGLGVVLGVTLAAWWLPRPEVAAALGLAGAGMRLLRRWTAVELLVGLGLGLLIVAAQPEGPRLRGPVAVVGVLAGAPVGRTVDVRVSRWAPLGGTWRRSEGRVRVVTAAPLPLGPGDPVAIFGVARALDATVLPGAPDPLRNAARGRLRTQIDATVAAPIGPEPAAGREVPGLLRAIALGDRSGIDADTSDLLRRTGTSHLLAVSGFHVALFAGGALWALRVPTGLLALVRPRGVPAWAVAGTAAAAGVAFTVAVGSPVSAQRAAAAVVLVALGHATGRIVDPRSILGLAATAVLVADPVAVGGASFHLSFGAVAGLVTWGPRLVAWVPERPRLLAWTGKGLAASAAASIGTLPACAWWFQQVPLLGPVANLPAVPFTSIVLTPLAFAALYAPEPVGGVAIALGSLGCDLLVAWLRLCDVPPWRPGVGPVGALLLCGVFPLARRPLAALALVVVVLLHPPLPPRSPRVTFPDVGQGSAALLEWPDGRRWLVDGGTRRSGVAAWLRRRHVGRLDVVVASHGDDDHDGGLVEVLESVRVGQLHVAGTDGLEPLLEVAARRGVRVVDDPSRRLHPVSAALYRDRNDASVVIEADLDGRRVLLPGDVPAAVERTLPVGPAEVLALAHHGSRTSSDPGFLAAVAPHWVVVQAGRGNRYGHPHPEVVRAARAVAPHVLRTDLLGTVEITLGDDPVVRTWHPGRGWRRLATSGPRAPP